MHLQLEKVDNFVEYVDNFFLAMWKTLLKMWITLFLRSEKIANGALMHCNFIILLRIPFSDIPSCLWWAAPTEHDKPKEIAQAESKERLWNLFGTK